MSPGSTPCMSYLFSSTIMSQNCDIIPDTNDCLFEMKKEPVKVGPMMPHVDSCDHKGLLKRQIANLEHFLSCPIQDEGEQAQNSVMPPQVFA
jgi:hypothetical protein